MFCTICGTQNADSSTFCSRCGNSLQLAPTPPPPMPPGVTAAATAPAPAYIQPQAVPAPPKTMHWLGMLGMAVALLLMLVYAAAAPLPSLPNHEQEIGYRFGTFLAPFAIGIIVAWLAAGRKKRRNPTLFAVLFCVIGGGMVLMNVAAHLNSGFETTDQKMSRLMREAAGLQPPRKPLFGESKMDSRMRDLFRDLISINRQYQEELDKLDVSHTAVLATPPSFADPDSAQAGLKELHASYDLDSRQEERMQQLLENFKNRFNDFSPAERDQFLQGVDQGLSRVMPIRRKALESEKAWVDSLDDIYDFARTYHSSFSLTADNHLLIADPQLLEAFNTRIETMNHRRSDFDEAQKAFAAIQNSSLQKVGISREQAGAH